MIDEDEPELGCVHIHVGFHSGHVVSNVIGSLNPRYGLFGDTMNTASRMESNSTSGRIHCSDVSSAKLLREQAPEFPMKRRGKVAVKGKGNMTTYWVGFSHTRRTLDESSKRTDIDASFHVRAHGGINLRAFGGVNVCALGGLVQSSTGVRKSDPVGSHVALTLHCDFASSLHRKFGSLFSQQLGR
mmetsp:Transcript_17834/g.44045  ORF Transcript_17834/g.44045 Transcript_17834/m.44045 type:complete len:186 (-) Transcript_17834:3729-4286(-)